MKKLMRVLLILILVFGIVGCDYSDESSNMSQNENNYENEAEEGRTYNGVVYDKAYFSSGKSKSSSSESYYVFSESAKKVIKEVDVTMNGKTPVCHVFEGTFEGKLGDKVILNFTKWDNQSENHSETFQFEDGKAYRVITESSRKHLKEESPTTVISRTRACYAEKERQNRS